MKKSTLTECRLFGFASLMRMKNKTFQDLKLEVTELEANSENKNFTEFANDLKNNFGQFDILHDYFVRSKLNKIESHLSTIKTIVVIYLILSIVAGLVIGLSVANV